MSSSFYFKMITVSNNANLEIFVTTIVFTFRFYIHLVHLVFYLQFQIFITLQSCCFHKLNCLPRFTSSLDMTKEPVVEIAWFTACSYVTWIYLVLPVGSAMAIFNRTETITCLLCVLGVTFSLFVRGICYKLIRMIQITNDSIEFESKEKNPYLKHTSI